MRCRPPAAALLRAAAPLPRRTPARGVEARIVEPLPGEQVGIRVDNAVVAHPEKRGGVDLEMQVRRRARGVAGCPDEPDYVAGLHLRPVARERRVTRTGARSRTRSPGGRGARSGCRRSCSSRRGRASRRSRRGPARRAARRCRCRGASPCRPRGAEVVRERGRPVDREDVAAGRQVRLDPGGRALHRRRRRGDAGRGRHGLVMIVARGEPEGGLGGGAAAFAAVAAASA